MVDPARPLTAARTCLKSRLKPNGSRPPLRQPISRNPPKTSPPIDRHSPQRSFSLGRTPVDPTLSSCVPHSAICPSEGEGSSSDEDAAPTGAAILIEHLHALAAAPLRRRAAAPRFPPRPLATLAAPLSLPTARMPMVSVR